MRLFKEIRRGSKQGTNSTKIRKEWWNKTLVCWIGVKKSEKAVGNIFDSMPDSLQRTQPKELCCDALFTCVTGLCNTPTGLALYINAARQHLSERTFHTKFTEDYLHNKTIHITIVLHCYGKKIDYGLLCPCVEWSNELMNFVFAFSCVHISHWHWPELTVPCLDNLKAAHPLAHTTGVHTPS